MECLVSTKSVFGYPVETKKNCPRLKTSDYQGSVKILEEMIFSETPAHV